MEASTAKPRLLFFQFRYGRALPPFLLLHKEEHARCLRNFFDVVVVSEDCDYAKVCDRVQPDLVLFESGVNNCQRLKISNTSAHPHIPKLALHNADPFCNARAGFVSDLEQWGIDTAFAIATTAAEHMPELADRIFVWPNAVDPALYRDYGAWKSIPVLLTGNGDGGSRSGRTSFFYPWRRRVFRVLADHYPYLQLPHPGYESGTVQLLFGEPYARTINASVAVPTCGTVAREIVRKHFEIPGCRTLLVTERSQGLEAAGFVNGENCVFADEHDVLERLGHLFAHPDELKRVTDAGFALVHARHTHAHRDQIRQWYDLNRSRAPGQRIVQPDPFGSLRLVPSDGAAVGHVRGDGEHLALLRKGDEQLRAGSYGEAAALYRTCMNYMPWMPEPRVRLALCDLHTGDARSGFRRLEDVTGFVLVRYGAEEPDPVEWALRIVALLCLGRRRDAERDARTFPSLSHPLLDRARWAAAVAADVGAPPAPSAAHGNRRRATLHVLPDTDFDAWLEEVRRMLAACGQHDLAEMLRRAAADGPRRQTATIAPETQPAPTFRAYVRRVERDALRFSIRRRIAPLLHGVERRFGPFLPYPWSIARTDDFYRTVRELAATQAAGVVLVVGAAPGTATTEALLAGAGSSEPGVAVHCVTTERLCSRGRRRHPGARWYAIPDRSPRLVDLDRALEALDLPHGATVRAVLVAPSVFASPLAPSERLRSAVAQASAVFIDGTRNAAGHALLHDLISRGEHVVVTEDPGLRGGYAVLRRLSPAA